MSSLSTPPTSKGQADGPSPPSPSLKTDGISTSRDHLPRSEKLQEIYNAAIMQQHVVIGASASTGKTSLLQLLIKELKMKEVEVIRITMNATHTVTDLMEHLNNKGIDTMDVQRTEKKTWLLLDDAQNAYDSSYAPFWQFVVKTVSSADVEDALFVVIAATYDLATPESPVQFASLEHIDPNILVDEARHLFRMHTQMWGFQGWKNYLGTILQISKLSTPGPHKHHIGVVIAAIRVLDELRKQPGRRLLTEEEALYQLRGEFFIKHLDRCFKLPNDLPEQFKDCLLDVVIGSVHGEISLTNDALSPFLRAGLLTKSGTFSCIASKWYYNHRCFPNRAASAPESLDALVELAVSSISAKRLRDTLVDGFPKEATFQHLFNEALSLHLPFQHIIIPELNTFATDSHGSVVNGELDFYINGSLKWCLELLRNGDKIGEHIARFDEDEGKYRKVVTNDFLVVDCRGQKKGGGVRTEQSRCTLYFEKDFKSCVCQMRNKPSKTIRLIN